ncbi:MAG: hypothetical protein O3A02_02195 [bacterium]|nr:hypothetical protein [bacterium]
MRTPLAPFLVAELPDAATAGSALRFVYAATFLAQVALAVAVGALLVWIGPSSGRPHDLMSAVLVAMAAVHLPIGLLLAWAVSRRPGKGSALVGALTAAVVLSVPAWFAVLLAITGQRFPYVAAAWALVALGYAGGMVLTPSWVRRATLPADPPAAAPTAGDVPPAGATDRAKAGPHAG